MSGSPAARTTRTTVGARAVSDVLAPVLRRIWLPIALLLVVIVLDAVQQLRPWPVVMTAALDEPAHLSTALLVLLAVAGPTSLVRHRRFTVAALVMSMAIDLDHIPLYAGVPHIDDGGRPYSHSLSTVLVLGPAAAAFRLWRPVLAGMATGVALHFVRDASTGPGLVLFWPGSFETVRLSYALYLWVLVAVTVIATVRALRQRAFH